MFLNQQDYHEAIITQKNCHKTLLSFDDLEIRNQLIVKAKETVSKSHIPRISNREVTQQF